uniref:Uncharacterized protein n=1 Tax=Arundo donax TaxID=35708 RepID=A0A0A9AZ73_ARUDO
MIPQWSSTVGGHWSCRSYASTGTTRVWP